MGRGTPWTQAEDDTLRGMRARMATIDECAAALGRTHGSVRKRWYSIKPRVPRRPKTGLTRLAAQKMAKALRSNGWVCRPPWHRLSPACLTESRAIHLRRLRPHGGSADRSSRGLAN